MNEKPYIGITGFMNKAEMVPISLFANSSRNLMVGVLVSSKTCSNIKNRYPNRYPTPVEQIRDIFIDSLFVFNVVHYNTDHTEPNIIVDELMRITFLVGHLLHGFQLNMTWPDPDKIVASYKKHFPDQKIILQIGKKAMDQLGHPEKIADYVQRYEHLADYVLFDPSGGLGELFQPSGMLPYLRAIKNKGTAINLGIAGGLSGENVRTQLSEIITEFPNISIDAEGRLRNEDDTFNYQKARAYIENALELFSKKEAIK